MADLSDELYAALSRDSADLRRVLTVLQRYQPDGSPPPGGPAELAAWILREATRRPCAHQSERGPRPGEPASPELLARVEKRLRREIDARNTLLLECMIRVYMTRLADWADVELEQFVAGDAFPASPAATTCAHHAFVIKNGDDTYYRTMDQGGITWTDDAAKALHFARREDAEWFCAEDEDAWIIRDVGPAAACTHQGPYREALQSLHHIASSGSGWTVHGYAEKVAAVLRAINNFDFEKADQQAASAVPQPTARERQLEEALQLFLDPTWPKHDSLTKAREKARALLTPAARGTTTD